MSEDQREARERLRIHAKQKATMEEEIQRGINRIREDTGLKTKPEEMTKAAPDPADAFGLRITALELAITAWGSSGPAEASYLIGEARAIEDYLRGIPPVVEADVGPII